MKTLTADFFDRPTTEVAEDLIGKFLIRKYNDHQWVLMVTEVEAYDGPDDKASHAHKGKTIHTESMFAHAGTLCIFAHGAHGVLNITTGPKDYPASILIRGALVMLPTGEIEHINSPTKLTRFLKIGSEFNGLKAAESSNIWLEDRDIAIPKEHIIKKQRIGVDYAAEWKDMLYNFSIAIERNKQST